jgi:hypothetical protein
MPGAVEYGSDQDGRTLGAPADRVAQWWCETLSGATRTARPSAVFARSCLGPVRRVSRRRCALIDKYRRKPTGPTIPLPGALEDPFAAAGRVSIAIRAPFSRIDLDDIRGRVVEITPRPGLRGGSVLISTSPSATRGSGPRSGCGGTSRTACHPRRIGDRGQWGVGSRRAARACRCRASGLHSSVAISTEAEKRCTRKLPIGLGVIVAVRTMGARCCRSGSCRRSVRR